ncbi:uncharacterized protein YdaL [Paenibacillus anaericanus]|uniref:DUF2334 domain-containing protein n=1 Tax=Paenibacillus anaericanus TaxID=170367 RepID=UPI00277DA49B|nr:DUF2334 domain-containing protein [Paenibacillus anaericanus]MDQ0088003.1 uncharacterized protein YdaL [Paenibacillus anaericanus]
MHVKLMIRTLIVTLVVILGIPLSFVHASKPEPAHVLIIYDSLAKGTSREGNIEALQRLLASFGVKVTETTMDNYKKGTLAKYTSVIAVRNANELTISNTDYIQDFASYEGDYLHIGVQLPSKIQTELNLTIQNANEQFVKLSIGQFSEPTIHVSHMPYIVQAKGSIQYGSISSENNDMDTPYAVRHDGLAYVPYYEKGNLSEIALAYVLKDWLRVTEQGKTYLLFKEVYPFSDLPLLEKLADKLYSAGIPFIVSVRPVFHNTDYPAMQRYLETLKYVQSHNGSILVNTPVVSSTIQEIGPELKAQMELFVDVLADYGIAPLGIGAEMYWTYDQQYSEYGMGSFDSAVLFPNENIRHRSQTDSSKSFSSSVYTIQLDFLEQFEHTGKVIERFPMSTALVYNFFETEAELDQNVQAYIDSWITFDDYKSVPHNVQTQANTISTHNGMLEINGYSVDLNNAYRTVSPEYSYKPEPEKSFETLFSIQNKIFIVLILLTLFAFGIMFIIGYRLYKRKYLNRRR